MVSRNYLIITFFNMNRKKLYLHNGKEVKVGDTIVHIYSTEHPIYGKFENRLTILVTEDIIPFLIKDGILETKEAQDKINLSLDYFHDKLLKNLENGKKGIADAAIINLYNSYPFAVFNILLREVAIELDKKYEDHIENSPRIFGLSNLNGKIVEVNKATIRNYKNFAAFRSIEDAKIACNILRDYIKALYAKRK